MKPSRTCPLRVLCGILAMTLTSALQAAESARTFTGDGLTITVSDLDEDTGAVRGTIRRGDETWPFTGQGTETDEAYLVRGTFSAGGTNHAFTSRLDPDSEALSFTTGGKTYRLQPLRKAAPPAPAPDHNPLGAADTPTPAHPNNPDARPEAPPPDRAKPQAAPPGAAVPEVMRFRIHKFQDVTMGGVPAYTALVPADWQCEGRVEWRNVGEVLFPQTLFRITTPQGGRLTYVPNMTLTYLNAPGLGRREGIPAPGNFPQWFASALPKLNNKVSNVRMLTSQRDQKLEALSDANDRAVNANNQGTRREIWRLTYEYDEDGVRRREQTIITYVAYAPFHGLNGFTTQTWGMFFLPFVSAPAEQFDQLLKPITEVMGTVRPTLRWFTLSQAIIAENSRHRMANISQVIAERGRQIAQMPITKADEQRYSKGINSDDAQHQRLNSLNEREDYKDVDGTTVNLPIHGKYKWSDGQGNIVISNTYQKPGESWQEITPAR